MGTAFITRRGGGGYAEGDTIPTANLQPVYSALDFTKTFVTSTYSPNTTTAWSNVLDTFILSDGVTVLQITTTAFNLFKISEPLTLIATATHDSYSSSDYASKTHQKFAVNEIIGQFYTLYNGYIYGYSLTTLEQQWSTQYNSSDWSSGKKEGICINPTDHTLWYIGVVGSSNKLIRYNPVTGAATQTYIVTVGAAYTNYFERLCIYDGAIYCVGLGGSYHDIEFGSWNLSTGAKILEGNESGPSSQSELKGWLLYQKYLYFAYWYDSYSEFRGERVDMSSSSYSRSIYFYTGDNKAASGNTYNDETLYHPVGIMSDGSLFLIWGGVGTKVVDFSGVSVNSTAPDGAKRSVGSAYTATYYNDNIIKGPNYPVIGSEGFCYYPDTNDSAITQVTNLPTGYKVLSED